MQACGPPRLSRTEASIPTNTNGSTEPSDPGRRTPRPPSPLSQSSPSKELPRVPAPRAGASPAMGLFCFSLGSLFLGPDIAVMCSVSSCLAWPYGQFSRDARWSRWVAPSGRPLPAYTQVWGTQQVRPSHQPRAPLLTSVIPCCAPSQDGCRGGRARSSGHGMWLGGSRRSPSSLSSL